MTEASSVAFRTVDLQVRKRSRVLCAPRLHAVARKSAALARIEPELMFRIHHN